MEEVKLDIAPAQPPVQPMQLTDLSFESALPLLMSGKGIKRDNFVVRLIQYGGQDSVLFKVTEGKDGRLCYEAYALSGRDLTSKWSLDK